MNNAGVGLQIMNMDRDLQWTQIRLLTKDVRAHFIVNCDLTMSQTVSSPNEQVTIPSVPTFQQITFWLFLREKSF
ncbi:MAG: hypothetical protein VW829_09715 [Deltaproteobacteria bacterium]